MAYSLLADIVVLLHFGFIVFVVSGGLLALRWRRAVWIHIPAALWGGFVEITGWACPLTPLENSLRRAVGEAGYSEGFVDHDLRPVSPMQGSPSDSCCPEQSYGASRLPIGAGCFGRCRKPIHARPAR